LDNTQVELRWILMNLKCRLAKKLL
jgi:hypothetical protein